MISYYFFLGASAIGLVLVLWSSIVNPNANQSPDFRHTGGSGTRRGPYQFLKHPIYIGEWMLISGLAGLAAGWWNFIAIGLLTDLLLRDWKTREERR